MKFAKLLELENSEQVLLVKKWNEEDSSYDIVITMDFDGVVANMTMSFDSEEKQEKAFDKFLLENAEKLRAGFAADFS